MTRAALSGVGKLTSLPASSYLLMCSSQIPGGAERQVIIGFSGFPPSSRKLKALIESTLAEANIINRRMPDTFSSFRTAYRIPTVASELYHAGPMSTGLTLIARGGRIALISVWVSLLKGSMRSSAL